MRTITYLVVLLGLSLVGCRVDCEDTYTCPPEPPCSEGGAGGAGGEGEGGAGGGGGATACD